MANNQIALLARGPDFETPIESQSKALQLRNLMNQGQMQDMEMDQRKQSLQRASELRATLSGFKPDASTDDQVGALTRGGHLTEARSLAESAAKVNKDKRESEKAELEGHFKKFEIVGQIMGGARDQATYDQARAQMAQIFPEQAQNMPTVFNAAEIEQKKMQAMGVKDQLANMWKEKGFDQDERKFDEDKRQNRAQEAETRRGHNLTAGNAAARLRFDKSQAEGADTNTSDAMVDMIGTGRMSPPSGYALRNPKIVAMMERVATKYPEFDATEYEGKKQAMRNFTTGKQGDSVRSFAVASDHLRQLDHLVDALENRDLPLINRYANKLAQQTGSAAPTNFDAAKGIVAKEVMKSIVAGGGGVEERQELSHLLDNAKTGKQLKGVIGTYLHLMEAQKEGLERQYELSTGRKDAKTRFNYSPKPDALAPTGGKPSLDSIFGKPN